MRSPPSQQNNRKQGRSKIFETIERWTQLTWLKGRLNNSARLLVAQKLWHKKLLGVGLYLTLTIVTIAQITAVLIFILSILATIIDTTPILATLINPDLTSVEKFKTIAGFAVEPQTTPSAQGGPQESCKPIEQSWNPDLNSYIDNQVVRLRPSKPAGTIAFKEPISSFFGLELVFKSQMVSGINAIISLKNSNGTLKYAIGDGDFSTVNILYTNSAGIVQQMESMRLPSAINNAETIGVKLNTVEKAENTTVLSTLTYYDKYGDLVSVDLSDMAISNSNKIYTNLLVGLDARQEPHNNVGLEIVSCSIAQMDPSKLLNM